MTGVAGRAVLLALALAMALASPLSTLAQAVPPAASDLRADDPSAADPFGPPAGSAAPPAAFGGIPADLQGLGEWLAEPAIDGNGPIDSVLLGRTLSAEDAVAAYSARSAASATPLADAVSGWAEALGLPAPDAVAIAQAGRLPRDVQLHASVLLQALTDATLLQQQAVAGVEPKQYGRLVRAPGAAMAGVFDASSPWAPYTLGLLKAAAADVDQDLIAQAGRVLAAAVQSIEPGVPAQATSAATEASATAVAAVLDGPAGLAPLGQAQAALQAAARLSGLPAPQAPAAREPATDHPLRRAVLEWSTLSGAPLAGSAPQLAEADALPAPLQAALARVLLAAADWQRAVADMPSPDDPQAFAAGRLQALGLQVAFLAAVERSAPTVQAWGLVWSRSGNAALPVSALGASASASDALAAAQAARTDIAAALAFANPGMVRPAPSTDTRIGSFADAVVELQAVMGAPMSPNDEVEARAAAGRLPVAVERNAARLLWAEVEAIQALLAMRASLSPEDIAALATPPTVPLDREATVEDVAALRHRFEVEDRILAVHMDGAVRIARATQEAAADLAAYSANGFRDPAPAKSSRPWWSFLPGLGGLAQISLPSGSATPTSVQRPSVPNAVCPTPETKAGPFTDCANDIWFSTVGTAADPSDLQASNVAVGNFVRGAHVIISGPGSSVYPMKGGAWSSVLNLDLGGDDEYHNNAGGAAFINGVGLGVFPVRGPNNAPPVALSFDLAGNDQYSPPARGDGEAKLQQGAALGGVGILFDAEGDDTYTTGTMSQGFAGVGAPGNPGIGILADRDGNDRYRATQSAQGSTAPLPVASGVDSTHAVGLLLDAHGDDLYELSPGAVPAIGQAGGDTGVAMLLDGDGDDKYRNGRQGRVTGVGVGILADLNGTDEYTRAPVTTYRDGSCWASPRVPFGALLDPETGQSPTVAGAQANFDDGRGLFLDADEGTCDAMLGPVLPYGADDPRDTDGDGWPDFVESFDPFRQTGTGAADAQDYPAGLPLYDCALAGPAADACEAAAAPLPSGSGYLLRIPGLVAVGDAVANVHPAATASDVGRDYALFLDIGGDDLYLNRMGGAPGVLPAPMKLDPTVRATASATLQRADSRLLMSIGVDYLGADEYRSDGTCVQGCNGMLIDLAGSDRYLAQHAGSAGCPCMAQGGTLMAAPGTASLLLDSEGDDEYSLATLSDDRRRGTFGQGAVIGTFGGLAFLLDAAGSDRYRGASQGYAQSPETQTRTNLAPAWAFLAPYDRNLPDGAPVALFLEVEGDDRYMPVGLQGISESSPSAQSLPAGVPDNVNGVNTPSDARNITADDRHEHGIAVFLDRNGSDRYLGTVANPGGADFSTFLNDRVRLMQEELSVGAFWDQERGAPRPPATGDLLADPATALDLPALGIAIGTQAPESYDRNYALLYDPGGDDTYRNNAGATLLRSRVDSADGRRSIEVDPSRAYPVASVLFDASGSDLYHAPDFPALSPSGTMDASTLSQGDLSGILPLANGVLAQGTGVLGVGILRDDAGDDRYVARGFAQGAAFLGVGLLWDRAGNDTYGLDPVVTRAPEAHGGAVAWEELSGGQWGITAAIPSGARSCRVSSQMARGPAAQVAFRVTDVAANEAQAAYSAFDDALGVSRIMVNTVDLDSGTEQNPCIAGSAAFATTYVSEQRNPTFAGDLLLWEDRRGGDADLYQHSLSASNDASNDVAFVARPGNQTAPDADGILVVWQDDADGGGRSAVYLGNLLQPGLVQRLTPPMQASTVRQDVAPRIAHGVITWQSRTCDAALAQCDPWTVVVMNRLVANALQRTCTLAQPGLDLVAPDTAFGEVVAMRADGTVFKGSWSTDCQTPLQQVALDGAMPRLDRSTPGLALQSMRAPEQKADERLLRPAASPYPEVLRLAGTAEAVLISGLKGRTEERFLQGSAFLPGLGMVLDESGNDEFNAGQHSQGASFEAGQPKTSPGQQLGQQSTQGAHGVLVSLGGNDRFTAQAYSQGADLMAPTALLVSTPPIPTGPGSPPSPPMPLAYLENAAGNEALLLTVRGANVYTANERSQGFSGLAAGLGAAPPKPGGGAVDPNNPPEPGVPQVLGTASVGLLVDLGGIDDYRYNPVRAHEMAIDPGIRMLPTAPPCDIAKSNPLLRYVLRSLPADCEATQAPLESGDAALGDPNNKAVFQGDQRTCTNEPACKAAQPVVVGGVRFDLPLVDRVNRPVTAQANERLLDIHLSASQDGQGLGGSDRISGTPATGVVRLLAEVHPRAELPAGTAVVVDGVEFYLGSGLIGYGTEVAPSRFALDYDTAQTPDGRGYLVTALVLFHVAPPGDPQATTAGHGEDHLRIAIDNPTKLLGAAMSGATAFSPFPWATGDDVPAPPSVSFSLLPDIDSKGRSSGHAVVAVEPAEGGPVVAYLRPGASASGPAGWPVDGTAEVSWDGLRSVGPDAGDAAPPGLYRIVVQASDRLDAGGSGLDASRATAPESFGLRLDSQPPRSGCIRLLTGAAMPPPCNPHTAVNTGNSQVTAGQARVVLDLSYDTSSSPTFGKMHLFRAPADGSVPTDPDAWTPVPVEGTGAVLQLAHGAKVYLAVLVQDGSGNLECNPACGEGLTLAAARSGTVREALRAKLVANHLPGEPETPSVARLHVDVDRPIVLLGNSGRPIGVDGAYSTAANLTRVGPTSRVDVSFFVQKAAPDVIPAGRVRFTSIEAIGAVSPVCYTRMYDVELELVSDGSPSLYRGHWDDWDELLVPVPGCDEWPEGAIAWQLDAFDPAGNQANGFSGTLVLDRSAPRVDFTEVRYPDDRLHAMAGDALLIVLKGDDPALSPLAQRPPNLLNIILDASELVQEGVIDAAVAETLEKANKDSVRPCQTAPLAHPGLVDYFFCYNAGEKAFLGRVPFHFPADGVDPVNDQARNVPVHYRLTDAVGNSVTGSIQVAVGEPRIGVQAATAQVGLGSATLQAYTVKEATAILEYGPDADHLESVPELDANPSDLHRFEILGLEPGVTYVHRVVATLPVSNAREAGPFSSFRVPQGVHVEVLEPAAGDLLSGLVDIRVAAGVTTDPGAEPRVKMWLLAPGQGTAGSPLFFDRSTTAGEAALHFVTDDRLDGAYSLVVTAEHDGETATTTVTGLLVDKRLPSVTFLSPEPGSAVAALPPRLLVRLNDADGGGFCRHGACQVQAELRIDDAPVEVESRFLPDAQGAAGILEIGLPEALRLTGPVRLRLSVADAAGNIGTATTLVFVDADAPLVESVAVLYPGTQQAARPGQPVRVLASFLDASGVRRAEADLTAAGGPAASVMQPTAAGQSIEFVVPADAQAGLLRIPLRATDAAGSTTRSEALVRIDTEAPQLVDVKTVVASIDGGRLVVNASEPVRLSATLALYGRTVRSLPETDLSAKPVLEMPGLVAGLDYVVKASATDAAGRTVEKDIAWRFVPLLRDPLPVTGLVARPVPGGVRLQWTPLEPPEAFQYIVLRSGPDGAFAALAQVVDPVFIDATAQAGREHDYAVQAVNLAGVAAPAGPGARSRSGDGAIVEAGVSPTLGLADETRFTFRAVVRSAHDERPRLWLALPSGSYAMEWASGDCRAECTFAHTMTLPALDLRQPSSSFSVEVLDGGVLLAQGSPAWAGPEVLSGSGVAAPARPPAAGLPAPSAVATFAVLAVAALAAWRRRQ